MSKHLYCCQNTLQNFRDHIIPVPDSFKVKSSILCGLSENDFIGGLRAMTDVMASVCDDMIKSPADYGLPLVEDIEYTPFNPKAADSKNSAHRLFALLNTLANSGELTDSAIVVNEKLFAESLKKLKSVHKVANSKMILKKLCDFGFACDGGVFSYADDANVIPALYVYMRNVPIRSEAAFSFNWRLAADERFTHPEAVAEYLSGGEREFFELLDKLASAESFPVGDEGDYRAYSYSVEYWIDAKDKKRIVRCHTENGRLRVLLKLHNSDCYDHYTESLPENIRQMFRKPSSCKFCKEACTYRLFRTFEGGSYTDCGYGNWFTVAECEPGDFEYYEQLIKLEAKAVKTNARKKGQKVYIAE